jgi:hypothetical protein
MQLALYDDGTVTPAWKGITPATADCSGPGIPSGTEPNVPEHRHQNSSRLACETDRIQIGVSRETTKPALLAEARKACLFKAKRHIGHCR